MTNSTPDNTFKHPRRTNGSPVLPAENPLMIGRSALGGRLLHQLKRAGWAGWSVMDNDALFSHNISKHVRPHVSHGLRLTGFMKYFDKPEREEKTHRGEKQGRPEKGGGRADLIVDVSGDSAIRCILASMNVARCASLFIAPTGEDSVLLLEDWGRSLRLDRIEPQYYRWLIHRVPDEDNRCEHAGNEPGEDARAAVAPSDALALHADALRRRFLSVVDKPAPALIACRRSKDAHHVAAEGLTPHPSLVQNICGWRIAWDKDVETKVLEMRWKEIPLETGGAILGYADRVAKSIFVVDVCPAPDDSYFRGALFQRGARGVSEAVETASRRTGNMVNYIGEWRSHPDAMFPIPGMDDLKQLGQARDEMAVTGHPPVILIIGENDLMFHVMFYD